MRIITHALLLIAAVVVLCGCRSGDAPAKNDPPVDQVDKDKEKPKLKPGDVPFT